MLWPRPSSSLLGGAKGRGQGSPRAWVAWDQRFSQWEKGMLPGGAAGIHWAGCSHLWEMKEVGGWW